MGAWTKVEDMLPIEEGKVLVLYGEPFFGTYTPEIECGHYDEESSRWLFWLTDKEISTNGVTHWMPLPNLPNI